ncbi:MAG: hypothetical protein Q7J35_13480 [Candidatus Methanoperedens sp.]|nr:hypothetical protein [Candidatus Methanoperedens sp.]
MKVKGDILIDIERTINSQESLYSPLATRNSQCLRRKQNKTEEPLIRPPFFRDADRRNYKYNMKVQHTSQYAKYATMTP